MASLIDDGGGKWRVSWCEGEKRPTVRMIGQRRDAEAFKRNVEALLSARLGGGISPALASWASKLPDATHADLARHGLLAPRVAVVATTLGGLIERQKAAAGSRVKAQTLAAYEQGYKGLLAHFGADRAIDTINAADAEAWQNGMTKLARATRGKRTATAKALGNAAVRWGLLAVSPFAGLRVGSQANTERMHYVPAADALRLIDAAPSHGWRCIIALARFAGLRCPSEFLDLRWSDVSWDRRSMLIRSPKTAHHAGGAERVVPIVPQLLAVLEAAWDAAPEGAVLIVEKGLERGSNLRTGLARIVHRAGLVAWSKPLQNLRASCECDWVEQFPAHEAARWMGHSPTVAARHYLQPRDANFRAATGLALVEAGGVAQIAAQHSRELVGNEVKRLGDGLTYRRVVQVVAHNLTSLPIDPMGQGRSELGHDSTGETHFVSSGGAESGAPDATAGPAGTGADAPGVPDDAGLAAVVEAWPILSAAARRVIVELVADARVRTG
jgi:integrase